MKTHVFKIMLVATALVGSAQARTYHVSPKGLDSNTGTAAAPWKSLAFALNKSVLAPGDVIQLAAGVYDEKSNTKISGKKGSPITIKGAGQGKTILGPGRLTVDSAFYVISGITFDSNYLLFQSAGASNNIVDSCEFFKGPAGILMKSDNGNDNSRPNTITIRNCSFHHPQGNGMVALTGDNHILENNVFQDNNGNDAIRVFGKNHIIRKNKFLRINAAALAGFNTTSSSKLEIATGRKEFTVPAGLLFTKFDYVEASSAVDPMNIMTGHVESYSGEKLVLNVVKVGGGGSYADWVINLSSLGNHGDIIQTFANSYDEATRDLLFEENYAENCTSQWGNLENNPDNNLNGNWTFRNNVFNRCRFTVNCYIPDVKFYNNTFFDSTGYTAGLVGKNSEGVKGEAHNMQVINNLFVRVDGIQYGSGAFSIHPALRGANAGFNAFSDLSDRSFSKFNLSMATSSLNGGFSPEQIFVAPAKGNFRLKAGSPAIGKGANLSDKGFNTGFGGVKRGAIWDMGAYVAGTP